MACYNYDWLGEISTNEKTSTLTAGQEPEIVSAERWRFFQFSEEFVDFIW